MSPKRLKKCFRRAPLFPSGAQDGAHQSPNPALPGHILARSQPGLTELHAMWKKDSRSKRTKDPWQVQ